MRKKLIQFQNEEGAIVPYQLDKGLHYFPIVCVLNMICCSIFVYESKNKYVHYTRKIIFMVEIVIHGRFIC